MKLILLFSIVSTLVLTILPVNVLSQNLSATRPQRVSEVRQAVNGTPSVSEVASTSDAEPDSKITFKAPWVGFDKDDSEHAMRVVGERLLRSNPILRRSKKLRPNHETKISSQHTTATFENRSETEEHPRLAPREPEPESTPQGSIEIIAPQMDDEFALRYVPVSINVNSSVKELQVLISTMVSGVKTIVYSRVERIADPSKPWKKRIDLEVGEYRIEAIGRDENGRRVGSSAAPISFKCLARNPHDVRSTFEASFYLGYGIDSFAASELREYLNPEAAGDTQERIVGGFDFGYRLFGDPMSRQGHQLWVYGETLHGVRSADVDCTANPNQPLCRDLLASTNPNPGEQLSAILRKATSLEAFAGLRWEFLGFNLGSNDAARAYFKTQFGFVTVAGLGGDVVDLHQYAGLGLTATKGLLRNSYVELGFGKSDFFLDNTKKRWKIDGFLSIGSTSEGLAGLMRPFAQITVDSDFGKGADSVQTYIGIDFDVSVLWRRTP